MITSWKINEFLDVLPRPPSTIANMGTLMNSDILFRCPRARASAILGPRRGWPRGPSPVSHLRRPSAALRLLVGPEAADMKRRRQIYEGKAKILYEGPEPGTLVQYFKD